MTATTTRSSNTKTILITGATAGIGRFTALYLAGRGHTVFATGRNTQALAELAAEARAAGVTTLETLRLDVTDEASVKSARDTVAAKTGGRLDALVNNAGYGKVGPLEEVPDAELRGQYETNVFGLVRVTRHFVPLLRAAGRGARLINISSIGGRITMPFMGAYNSTKFAVESLSDALRVELAPSGIRVVLIEPGAVQSEFQNTFLKEVEQYRHEGSPYARTFERLEQVSRRFEKMSAKPIVVARAIEAAATRRRPAARYVVPFPARLGLGFLRALPTGLMDFVMRVALGLPRRAPAALPAETARQLPAA